MKRFFTKTGIWLLGGAAVIAVVLCIISAMGSGTSFLHNALGVIASPFRAAGSAVVNWVDGISDHFASVEELQAENEALRQENAQLRKELQSAQPAAQENQRLRKLLDLREQRSDLKFEAARVTQRDVSNWASTLVLNRGSQHGVTENDCAGLGDQERPRLVQELDGLDLVVLIHQRRRLAHQRHGLLDQLVQHIVDVDDLLRLRLFLVLGRQHLGQLPLHHHQPRHIVVDGKDGRHGAAAVADVQG